MADTPYKRIAVDIVAPEEPRPGRKARYILIMIDHATRYPEAVALPSIETGRIAEDLVEMLSTVGILGEMLSDCGSQFTPEVIKEGSSLSFQHLTSTIYHLSCNGDSTLH